MVISVAASWGQPKGDVGLEFRKKCRAGNRHLEVNYREVQLNAGDQTGSLGVFREGEAKSWYRSFTEISRPYSLYLLTEKYHLPSVKDGIGEGNGTPLQYSCLENSMDRGSWWATVHEATKGQTWLSNWAWQQQNKDRKEEAEVYYVRYVYHTWSDKLEGRPWSVKDVVYKP